MLEELKEESDSGKLLALPPWRDRKRSWNPIWGAGLVALLLCARIVAVVHSIKPQSPASRARRCSSYQLSRD